MKKMFVALAAIVIANAAAAAASITNLDDADHTIVVTEGGNQSEFVIGPGQTIEVCPAGCFVQLPNGDREVLTGGERLEIEASRGRVFQ